jgi:hypothetical protein
MLHNEIQKKWDADEKNITEINRHFNIRQVQYKKEQDAYRSGQNDTLLINEYIEKAEPIQITPDPNTPDLRTTLTQNDKKDVIKNDKKDDKKVKPRERNIITRPCLVGLIHSHTRFRFNHKGKVHMCYTENGSNFTDDNGKTYKSLASWTVDVIERGGGGGRKVSVYEVCEVFIKSTGKWEKWGNIYHADTKSIH